MAPKFWLFAAFSWTILIVVLCLISFNKIPSISVQGGDKYVHAIFHFIFTILWILYFTSRFTSANSLKIAICVIALSFVFGAFIEVAQEMFTMTRKADAYDIVANFIGAVLGTLVLTAYDRVKSKDK